MMHIIDAYSVFEAESTETKHTFSSDVYLSLHASSNLGSNSIATCTQYSISTLNNHKQACLLVKIQSAHSHQFYV